MHKAVYVLFLLFSIALIPFSIAQSTVDSNEFKSNNIIPPDSVFLSEIFQKDSISESPTNSRSELLDFVFKFDSLDVYKHNFFPDSINYINLHFIDTSNHNSAEYNPTGLFTSAYNNLGMIGSAQENQIFRPSIKQGFNVGINNFDEFIWYPTNVQLYDVRTPYTELFYLMGSKRKNVLMFSHGQSFLRQQISINMNFRLFNHIGAYKRQKTDVKNFMAGISYRTLNRRYQIKTEYYHSKLILQENGGIKSLADFEENLEDNRLIIETNLANAANLIRVTGFTAYQDFYFSRPEPDLAGIPDTNVVEFEAYTVTHFKKPYFDPVNHLGKLSYYFNFERQNYKYTDSDQSSSLYDGLPFFPTYDSATYFDTIGVIKYSNELIYSNSDYKDIASRPKWLNYFFGAKHEFVNYYQACRKSEFQNMALIGGVFINFARQLSLSSNLAYYYGDTQTNDFFFEAKVNLKIRNNILTGGLDLIHRSPDYFYQHYSTSRFNWDSQLGKTDVQHIYAIFNRNRMKLSFNLYNTINYVYINQYLEVAQYSGNIQHIEFQIQKQFRLGHWGSDLFLTYQKTSAPAIIRIPDFNGKAKLFYFNNFFDNALDLELGIEFNYFSAYYANQYMPALRVFHLQDDIKIGDYIFMDVYLNAKIGKARLFVRYDHFNAGLMEYRYYASPTYPAQDAAFKFGVNWILFD